MKKPLAFFRYATRETVATLQDLKSIMLVITPRKSEFWLVLPAVGDSDAVCVFIRKFTIRKNERSNAQTLSVLKDYADRIIQSN